jgi:hypothetical protein
VDTKVGDRVKIVAKDPNGWDNGNVIGQTGKICEIMLPADYKDTIFAPVAQEKTLVVELVEGDEESTVWLFESEVEAVA